MQVKLRIFLASAQCLGYHLEKIIKLTNDMCYPSEDTILEQTEKMINSISPAALFVAVNGNHLIDKFQKRFTMRIPQISCKLKYLHITLTDGESTFLNGDHWERLIVQYLPELKKHHLGFRNYFNEVPEYSLDSAPSNPLNTPFWIKRQDILDIQMYTSNIKKRWYDDTQNKTVNSSVELSKSTRLTLVYVNPDAPHSLASIYTSHLSIIVQIFHLEIQIDDFLLQTLIEIMKYLPELTTLRFVRYHQIDQ
ncbi:unnamed protein product [Rotaria magnacalcarata]|uniref:Uncharacterized protein n=1 Tax=Rotaria magnacalcarata TaxID=392030 RepID=A0A815EXA9_9BILA|nr:unnamed protein product [Rotaria magnacalcarata]CAF1326797.1 unnamed protein product [Rotaria magnacalcarata]